MRKPKSINAIEKLLSDSNKAIKVIDTHYDILYMEIMGIKNRLTTLEHEVLRKDKQ